VTAAVFKAAEVGITHQADVAELGALDDDHVVFVEVLALVYEFHGCLRRQAFAKTRNDSTASPSIDHRNGFYCAAASGAFTLKNQARGI
jgi:hypothetical protein